MREIMAELLAIVSSGDEDKSLRRKRVLPRVNTRHWQPKTETFGGSADLEQLSFRRPSSMRIGRPNQGLELELKFEVVGCRGFSVAEADAKSAKVVAARQQKQLKEWQPRVRIFNRLGGSSYYCSWFMPSVGIRP